MPMIDPKLLEAHKARVLAYAAYRKISDDTVDTGPVSHKKLLSAAKEALIAAANRAVILKTCHMWQVWVLAAKDEYRLHSEHMSYKIARDTMHDLGGVASGVYVAGHCLTAESLGVERPAQLL